MGFYEMFVDSVNGKKLFSLIIGQVKLVNEKGEVSGVMLTKPLAKNQIENYRPAKCTGIRKPFDHNDLPV